MVTYCNPTNAQAPQLQSTASGSIVIHVEGLSSCANSEQVVNLRQNVDRLNQQYSELASQINEVNHLLAKSEASTSTEGESSPISLLHSTASRLGLTQLSNDIEKIVNGTASPSYSTTRPLASIPPQLHATHCETRNSSSSTTIAASSDAVRLIDGLTVVTDKPGPVVSTSSSTPGDSSLVKLDPESTVSTSVGSSHNWMSYYITTRDALSREFRNRISCEYEMITFHPDFIFNTLDGHPWTPGMRFVPGTHPCILKNRTYWILDPSTEPYLPKEPGQHGAKLTAFLKACPEDYQGEDLCMLSQDVPMFVAVKDNNGRRRYAYYGHYSRNRWADKLDYDAMSTRVPQHVKDFWATKLTASTRDKWVTEELKKHFFNAPEYTGYIAADCDDCEPSLSADKHTDAKRMDKHMKYFARELRTWEHCASKEVDTLSKDDILAAFERADWHAESALRLHWEYLECVDFNKDFYNLLVALQSRDPKLSLS